MTDTKISALTAVATAATTDEFPVNQGGTSKKETIAQLKTLLQTLGMTRVFGLAADHTVASTSGTEVTGLGPCTLEAGTYHYKFILRVQSATTTVGIGLGVNFTGTQTSHTILSMYPSTGTTAISGVADDVGAGTGQIMEHNVQTAFSTTAPNMVNTAGFATANADVVWIIEGTIVVTVSGDLELWHSSETATNTSVKAGSVLLVTRAS